MNEEAIFQEALALPMNQRQDYLDKACVGQPALQKTILLRLATHTATLSIAPQPSTAPAKDDDEKTGDYAPQPAPFMPTAPATIGTVIAERYQLVELIGEGGMGSVYRASQAEPVKRQVALKLVKHGMGSRTVLARFEAERQALALMDHPNIARIYDGGATSTGQPFFVMEFVQGEPLTEYCDRHRLTVTERLRLFVAVCLAVQHAHQKGIIHRDLKPGNVLVTEVDGRPTPKVIDFGVAKATEMSLTDSSFADTGAIVGTPMYMSPEQADPTSMDIDTRTDVYALGVILYELLAGTPPIDKQQFKRGAILEMLRMVREVDPPRPSTKLSTYEGLAQVAANRQIEPAKLAKLLQGELDWVVMKALEKDRTRRYESANSLGSDVQRYLADEVVEARPPSRSYRTRKFIRRYRVQVAAACVVFLALLLGMIGTTLGLLRAEEKRRDAEQAKADETERANERDTALGVADRNAKEALTREAEARFEARRANAARHAIQIEQAYSFWERGNLERMQGVLNNIEPEERASWESVHVRNLWLRNTYPIATLAGHTASVYAVAISPDGQWWASGSDDKTIKLWKVATHSLDRTYEGHTAGIRSLHFSPDGKYLASASADATIKIWDVAHGTIVKTLNGHRGAVQAVRYTPDGLTVVSGGADHQIIVWDVTLGQPRKTLAGHTGAVLALALNSDGTTLVSGSADNTAKVWSLPSGAVQSTFTKHTAAVQCVALDPTTNHVVSGSADCTARVWDAKSLQERSILSDHLYPVTSVQFRPDGQQLVTANGIPDIKRFSGIARISGTESTIKLWDTATSQCRLTLVGHVAMIHQVGYHPDGQRLISASHDHTLHVWRPRFQQDEADTPMGKGYVQSVAFAPDSKRLITTSLLLGNGKSTRGEWQIIDVTTGQMVRSVIEEDGHLISACFSPDGQQVLAGGSTKVAKLWNASTGEVVQTFRGHSGTINRVLFRPHHQQVLTCSNDHTMRLWDCVTGQTIREFKGHQEPVLSASFSADGQRLLSGSRGKNAVVWDVDTGEVRRTLQGHQSQISSTAITPDGRWLLTGSLDQTIRVWHADTGQEQFTLRGHRGEVNGIALSPDGSRVASAGQDQVVKVWDVATGQEKLTLYGHRFGVMGIAFRPDGAMIASLNDQSVKLWEAAGGSEEALWVGHQQGINALQSNATGTRLLSGSVDQTVKEWDVTTGQVQRSRRGATASVFCVAWNHAEDTIAAGQLGGGLCLWRGDDHEPQTIAAHRATISGITFRADGKQFATASWDRTIKLWDTASGKEMQAFQGHRGAVTRVLFHPDGKHLLSSSSDRTVHVWELASGKVMRTFTGHTQGVNSLALSPDGSLLATASNDETIKLWNYHTGETIRTLNGHTRIVTEIRFRADGRQIVSGSIDGTVRVWDAATGFPRRTLLGHTDAVTTLVVLPDGRLVSGCLDRMIRLWK